MPIASLSFPQGLLKEADELQKTSGYASRSELVRAAIHLLSGTERKKGTPEWEN